MGGFYGFADEASGSPDTASDPRAAGAEFIETDERE